MRRFPVLEILAVVLTLCLSWGCSQDKKYPQANQDNFLTSCMDGARDMLAGEPEAGGKNAEERAKAYCECSLEKVMQRIPFDEFMAIDKAMSAKGAIDPVMEKKLSAAISECQAPAGKGQ